MDVGCELPQQGAGPLRTREAIAAARSQLRAGTLSRDERAQLLRGLARALVHACCGGPRRPASRCYPAWKPTAAHAPPQSAAEDAFLVLQLLDRQQMQSTAEHKNTDDAREVCSNLSLLVSWLIGGGAMATSALGRVLVATLERGLAMTVGSDPLLWWQCGLALAASGRHEEALRALDECCTLARQAVKEGASGSVVPVAPGLCPLPAVLLMAAKVCFASASPRTPANEASAEAAAAALRHNPARLREAIQYVEEAADAAVHSHQQAGGGGPRESARAASRSVHVKVRAQHVLGYLLGVLARCASSHDERQVLEERALEALQGALWVTMAENNGGGGATAGRANADGGLAVAEASADPRLLYHLAVQHASMRHLDEAMRLAQALVRSDARDDPDVWSLLVLLLTSQKQPARALHVANVALAQWPRHRALLAARAGLLRDKLLAASETGSIGGDRVATPDAVVAAFERLVRHGDLGDGSGVAPPSPTAASFGDAAARGTAAAPQSLSGCNSGVPAGCGGDGAIPAHADIWGVRSWCEYAEACCALGDPVRAATCLERAHARAANATLPLTAPGTAALGAFGGELAAQAALLHACRGETAAAEREFAAALATDPHHLGALVGLGALHCECALRCCTSEERASLGYVRGRRCAGLLVGSVGGGTGAGIDGGVPAARNGSGPPPSPTLVQAGEVEGEKRDAAKQAAVDGALTALTRAVRVDARSHAAWHLLALVHRMLGNNDKASEALLFAVELEQTAPLMKFDSVNKGVA